MHDSPRIHDISAARSHPHDDIECPDWLGDYGREKWQATLPLLREQHGTRLTALDADALANYCHAYQNKREAMDRLQRFKELADADNEDADEVCAGPNGALYPHPDVGARNKSDERMKTWADVLEISFNKRKAKTAVAAPRKSKPA